MYCPGQQHGADIVVHNAGVALVEQLLDKSRLLSHTLASALPKCPELTDRSTSCCNFVIRPATAAYEGRVHAYAMANPQFGSGAHTGVGIV